MHSLATILLAMAPGPETDELIAALEAQSYSVQHLLSPDSMPETLTQSLPDVIVLGPSPQQKALLSELAQSPRWASIPLLVLTDLPLEDAAPDFMPFPIETVLQWPLPSETFLRELYPLTRLATMQAELARRQSVVSPTLDSLPFVAGVHSAAILVLGTSDIVHSVTMAMDDQASILHAQDLFLAQTMMEERRFDACVMAPSEDNYDAMLDLCLQIRRNPRLFNLPVLFISDKTTLDLAGIGATHSLSVPVHPARLRFALSSLVRLQQQRWSIRQEMRLTLTQETAASQVPEVYNNAFLKDYLTLCLENPAKRLSFSLVGLAFTGIDAIRHEFGPVAEAHLLGQIGQWLTLLVRAEDLVAHLGGNQFCVVLPDTPQEEASIVMNRIAGVISKTDFAVHDVYQVVTTWPYVQAIDLTDVQDAPSLIARVHEVLHSNQQLLNPEGT